MNSIQSRLATGLTVSLAAVFLMLWLAISSNVQKLSENYIASRIEHDIETLLIAITFDQANMIKINEQLINAVYKRPFSGHYYVIEHNNQTIRSRSLWDKNLITPDIASSGYIKTFQPGPENQSLLILTARFNKKNNNIKISAAEDLTPVIEDIHKFKNYFAGISALILSFLLLIQTFILHRGLKPLRKMQHELNRMEQGEINQLDTNVPHELKSVVNEVNHLANALHKRLKRSRDALSDLSHAIKKPLTLLQQFSSRHRSDFNADDNKFLNNQISTIEQITDRILKRARIAGKTKYSEPFNISNDLPLLINTIKMMYPDKNINVTLSAPGSLKVKIDREDMLELLGNLIENAWKWTKSKLSITINENDVFKVSIEDDGPGANTDVLNEAIQRGVRLDESVSGYGFGLAISSDIIRDYDGNIEFSRSESLGGFMVNITLPTNHPLHTL